MTLKLEVNTVYVTRSGARVGPLTFDKEGWSANPRVHNLRTFDDYSDGRVLHTRQSDLDIVGVAKDKSCGNANLTASQLADALGYFSNAAISAMHNGTADIACIAQGIDAVACRLAEIAISDDRETMYRENARIKELENTLLKIIGSTDILTIHRLAKDQTR